MSMYCSTSHSLKGTTTTAPQKRDKASKQHYCTFGDWDNARCRWQGGAAMRKYCGEVSNCIFCWLFFRADFLLFPWFPND
jgi:hypothetical protein